MTDTGWMQQAACRDESPLIFTPDVVTRHAVARAQIICRDCPVQTQCDAYARATGATDGIWAGLPRGPLQGRKPDKPLAPCGTNAAYWRHRRNGETPCDACTTANRQTQHDGYMARRYA